MLVREGAACPTECAVKGSKILHHRDETDTKYFSIVIQWYARSDRNREIEQQPVVKQIRKGVYAYHIQKIITEAHYIFMHEKTGP